MAGLSVSYDERWPYIEENVPKQSEAGVHWLEFRVRKLESVIV